MNKPIVVQKYGGSSVASIEKLRTVARLIVEKKRAGYDVVAVVSAMGDTTDELLERAHALAPTPDRRELDMLLSAGERIAMSLLAIAIRAEGFDAVSLTGSQSGIITTANHAQARIMEVRPFRVQDELERDRIVIVAGYQGVSYTRDVTTLGRGGSDTTAVALAAALDAEACEIFSDVDGVYTSDPRVVQGTQSMPAIGYEEMQALAEAGARVLNAEAVEFARNRGIAIYARKTSSSHPGTVIRRDVPKAPSGVRGIAFEARVGWITGPTPEGSRLAELLEGVRQLGGRIRHIHRSADAHGGARQASSEDTLCLLVGLDEVVDEGPLQALADRTLGAGSYWPSRGAVSLVGEGVVSDPNPLLNALETLKRGAIAVDGIASSSFRITLITMGNRVAEAANLLHHALGLDRPETEAQL
ncbi:MAG: aspartate kinase [Deltaproteobacteria bacterium]|nr:aspartate kinase [Deltaproteobacteria bacterium]